MEKKNIDWANLGFNYTPTDKRYSALYRDGAWLPGGLIDDPMVHISESAGVLQYSQVGFEGLKAYTTEDGRIVCFRPDMNAKRLQDTCDRLHMPTISEEQFIEAVDMLVRANAAWVPPYGSGATLYIRPFLYGSGPVLGVQAASTYEFRMYCSPVGPYFKGGVKPLTLTVSDYDRAAPKGTGHIKAGLNYAMSLYASYEAKGKGFAENMFLDSATHTKVEETGGANFIFVTKEGQLVTPKSETILPSITRRSLMYVAKEMLGMDTVEREVTLAEVPDFVECGLCGTAAVISPVGCVNDHGKEIRFASGMESFGPVLQKLYDTLTGIQMGRIEGPAGWVHQIM